MAPLNLTKINTPQDLQDALIGIVEQAQSMIIPPVQAIYDPRQLETLFADAQRLYEDTAGVFERMKPNTSGLTLGGFGDFFEAQQESVAPQTLEENSFITHGQNALLMIAPASEDLSVDLIHGDPPQLIAYCAKLKGIIVKACVNLERQTCKENTHRLSKYLDQRGALNIRDSYAHCRWALRDIDPHEQHDAQALCHALELTTQSLEKLRQNDSFSKMYYRDRLHVVELQHRATTMGAAIDPSQDLDEKTLETGLELLSEIALFREGLGQINHRQELIEHDLALLTQALQQWKSESNEDHLDANHWDTLQPLWGLDEQLDSWLLARPEKQFGLVTTILEQHMSAMS